MTGQNNRPDESLTGQAHDQAGHCPLTGRYFEPCQFDLRKKGTVCSYTKARFCRVTIFLWNVKAQFPQPQIP